MSSPHSISGQQLYLAIDQGGHASRALVFDRQGQLIAEAQCEIDTIHPALDRVEHDPDEMVASIKSAVKNVVSKLGTASKNIVAAGLATQRSNIVCWNRRTGTALSSIISWQDRRAYKWLEQFSDYKDRIHHITGLYPNAHYGVSKLKWCLENIPQVYALHKKGDLAWGPMSSFLCHRLLDEKPFVTDPVNASRTLLWDIHHNNWSDELFRIFNIPTGGFPTCVPTCYRFGTLSSEGNSIPMTIVTGDQSAALFAGGEPQQQTAYITIGTGAFISRITSQQPVKSSRLLSSIVIQNNEVSTYALEGTVNGAGSALSWVAMKTGLHKKIDNLSEWLIRDCNPPLFLNGISGLGTPLWCPYFTSSFIGDGEDWEKAVAVIESIVFLLQLNLEEMRKSLASPEKIIIGGGLSRFDGLCQRLANVSGLPVYRPEMHENTALGLAYILADRPAATWPSQTSSLCFMPVETPPLNNRYRLWKKALMAAVKSVS